MAAETALCTDTAMLESIGRVTAVTDGRVYLDMEPATACMGCAAKAGCGGRHRAGAAEALPGTASVRPGDRVVVGLPANAVLRSAALTYLPILLGLVTGALTGQALGGGDAGAMTGAGLGLAAGFVWARRQAARSSAATALTPVVLRRVAGSNGADPTSAADLSG